MLVLRPHVYVYHTCTRALHRAPSGKSLDCGSGSNCSEEQEYDKDHPGLVMLALAGADSVTATYKVGKQVACKAMEQPTLTICASMVSVKPILIKYAA